MRIDSPLMTNTVATGSFSGSFTGDGTGLTGVEGIPVGSDTQVQFNDNGSFGGSSNLTFDGTNLTVGGKVTATEIVTNVVSQSISFATGSNRFGDEISDTHTFTGSLLVTGSTHNIFGNVGIGTTSPDEKLTVEGNISASGELELIGGVTASVLSFEGTSTNIGVNAGSTRSSNTLNNVVIGKDAFLNSTSPDANVVIGVNAGKDQSVSGQRQVLIGYGAGEKNQRGGTNTAVGYQALYSSNYTFPGPQSSVAIGYAALSNGSAHSNNVAVGYNAGNSIQSGGNNVLIGYCTGLGTLTTGGGNTLVGYKAGTLNSNDSNSIVIGCCAVGKGSNTVVIGHSDITNNYFQGDLTVEGNISGSGCIQIGTGHTLSGTLASIGGGDTNTITSGCSFIGAGCRNCVTANFTSIVGGTLNTGSGACGFIGAGSSNTICSGETNAVIGGGKNNIVDGDCSSILGGLNNCIVTYNSVIAGGCTNLVCGNHSFIGSGQENIICSATNFSVIAGGCRNKMLACIGNTIGGGTFNCICTFQYGTGNTVAGGQSNVISGSSSESGDVIAGGCSNTILSGACCSTIGGGFSNKITGDIAAIVGGSRNTGSGACSGILGGKNNHAAHDNSMVIGSDLTSDKACYTFMNNLDVAGTVSGSVFSGSFVGDGSGLTGISGGGSIDGSGAANKLAIWTDSDTLTSDTCLHWDTSNNRLGIGTNAPEYRLQVSTPAETTDPISFAFDISRENSTQRGITFGMATNDSYGAIGTHNADIRLGHTFGTETNGQPAFYPTLTIQHIDEAVGRVGIGQTSPSTLLDVNGTTTTVSLVETSTKKLKEDIQPLDSQLENLKKLKPIEFAWKKDKKKDFGLLAEDVEKVYPYLVEHDEEGKLIGVKYSKLTSVLVKALQEQQEQIDELKEEIKVLKQK
jgi:hypothetical protein